MKQPTKAYLINSKVKVRGRPIPMEDLNEEKHKRDSKNTSSSEKNMVVCNLILI
jgi:hypothetical protein